MFARGLGGRRGLIIDDIGLDDDDLWETMINGVGDDAESAMESLAMEVSGEGSMTNRTRLLESRQRFMDAARAFSQATRESQSIDPALLLRFANENAVNYQPVWESTSSIGASRTRSTTNRIEVGEGERRNLAHVQSGAGEGLAIRAEPSFPKNDTLGSFRMPTTSNIVSNSQGRPNRRIFGFRVAFDHPACDQGGNMGGCYLVGVTTSSFTSFGEQNSLQQSPFFWGIEANGQKYEGSRYNQSRGARRTSSASSYSIELSPQDAPTNPNGVLFGSREIVTVIADFDSRNLTFWRDETLLGTLVHNLPRNINVYPIAVPFHSGVTVAITGLDNDPLPL